MCVCVQREEGENKAGGGGGRERGRRGRRKSWRVTERSKGGGGEGEEQCRKGVIECAKAQRSGRDRMQPRERGEGEVKDRGSENEEEAEEEGRERGRREGEISSCQMVSSKTSASSYRP